VGDLRIEGALGQAERGEQEVDGVTKSRFLNSCSLHSYGNEVPFHYPLNRKQVNIAPQEPRIIIQHTRVSLSGYAVASPGIVLA
jgi:hypothetical protein